MPYDHSSPALCQRMHACMPPLHTHLPLCLLHCHRDLKLDNTLLDDSSPPILKLCDFGFAKTWENYEDANMYTHIGWGFLTLVPSLLFTLAVSACPTETSSSTTPSCQMMIRRCSNCATLVLPGNGRVAPRCTPTLGMHASPTPAPAMPCATTCMLPCSWQVHTCVPACLTDLVMLPNSRHACLSLRTASQGHAIATGLIPAVLACLHGMHVASFLPFHKRRPDIRHAVICVCQPRCPAVCGYLVGHHAACVVTT
jgi:hypothetical protein